MTIHVQVPAVTTGSRRFQFGERVMTPKGPAIFLGYFIGSATAQVAIKIPASKYTRAENERNKPSTAEMSDADYKIWLTSAWFTVNEVFSVDRISGAAR